MRRRVKWFPFRTRSDSATQQGYVWTKTMSSASSSSRSIHDEQSADLIHKLTAAIQAGEDVKAMELVTELTARKLKLDIAVPREDFEVRSREAEFSVKVNVEDRESKGCVIHLMVKSCDTIADLKRKMMLKHDFPMEVQRWIIGNRIWNDKDRLSHCGVKEAGHTLYLYLVTARSVGLSRQQYDTQKQAMMLGQTLSQSQANHRGSLARESSSEQNTMNFSPLTPPDSQPTYFNNSALNIVTPQVPNLSDPHVIQSQMSLLHSQGLSSGSVRVQEMLQSPVLPSSGSQQNLASVLQFLDNSSNPTVIPTRPSYSPTSSRSDSPAPCTPPLMIPSEPNGWICPQCTYINLPMRPGCELCTGPRPAEYQVPHNYQLTEDEKILIQNEEQFERLTRQADELALNVNYQNLLAADDLDLVPNPEAFTCPICFDHFEEREGILLRECLHMFCKDCLSAAVMYSEEAELKCPFQDDQYACEAALQDREIRKLVPPVVYEKFLQRGLNQAESQAANSYHCKTANCHGWCLYEDLVNFFHCPVCQKENCLTCKAIHEGMNCKQYQDDLRIRANNDVAAKQTKDMLEELVRVGDAMHCPQCGVVVQKKEGCDWIKCSICKTELCWVTKMSRWGPNGNGDTSGGCRCRVNGKCHPDCMNCH